MYASETKQNCKNPTGHIDTLSDFSKTQLRYNLKTLAQPFQIAIHFHPGDPQLKTLI